MAKLRIAQAQINPTVGDIDGNISLILKNIKQAIQKGCDLITFPELAITGYPPEDLLLKPRFIQDTVKALREVALASQGIHTLLGCPLREDGCLYNTAILLGEGGAKAIYRKAELPNYGVFDEKRYFNPGGSSVFLEIGGARIILTICEDAWVEGSLAEEAARRCQAQISLNISASPFQAGKLALRRRILAGFARRTGTTVLYNNLVGGQDELIFDGGSLVISPQGDILAHAAVFQEELMINEIELPEPQTFASPDCSDLIVSLPFDISATKPEVQTSGVQPELGPVEEVHQALVLGVRDYVRKNGFKKTILGLSGGIDSSLVAAIAVQALGAENVVGVTMPSQYTSQETLGDAGLLAENLGMEIIAVPIKDILASYQKEMRPSLGPGELGVVSENLQARIRGNILMGMSNRFGHLVLTTGNKSETAVGYCTLYGDMAGGFALIKDVPKTLVYKLSEFVNQKAGKEIIPETVIKRPPTAELRPDQKDEDSLPPYEVLDAILEAYVEGDMIAEEITAKGFDPEVVRQVARLVDLNEYKRRQAPPGVKITPKAFGRDRRLPITNLYRPGWNHS